MKEGRAQKLFNWTLQRRSGLGEKGKLPRLEQLKIGDLLALDEPSNVYLMGTTTPEEIGFICTEDILGIRRDHNIKIRGIVEKKYTILTLNKIYTVCEHTARR